MKNTPYTRAYLNSKPTLSVGQDSNLKVQTPYKRVWLSRMSVEDGAPYSHEVMVEHLDKTGRWVIVDRHQAR